MSGRNQKHSTCKGRLALLFTDLKIDKCKTLLQNYLMKQEHSHKISYF